jgi:hypothetical protein
MGMFLHLVPKRWLGNAIALEASASRKHLFTLSPFLRQFPKLELRYQVRSQASA